MRGTRILTRLGAMLAVLGVMTTVGIEAAAAASEVPLSFRARGNEPFWDLTINADGLVLKSWGKVVFQAKHYERKEVHGITRIEASQKGRSLAVTVRNKLCASDMAGMVFPFSVRLSIAGRHLRGCGGEIMDALAGDWRVVRMGGAPLPASVAMNFDFARDGSVSGQSGCNRFFGDIKVTGESLHFGPLGMTRMACPDPQREAEETFMKLVPTVTLVMPGEGRQIRLLNGHIDAFVLERVK